MVADISKAFPELPLPRVIAGRPGCGADEYSYVEEFFRDKMWTEITLEDLKSEYPGPPDACLSFMSPEAFRYFLPAYMRFFLERWDEADAIADAAVFVLIPTSDPKLVQWQLDRFRGFDHRQRRAIADFLAYAGETYGSDYDTFGLPEAKAFWSAAP